MVYQQSESQSFVMFMKDMTHDNLNLINMRDRMAKLLEEVGTLNKAESMAVQVMVMHCIIQSSAKGQPS